jgi:hypothetical protein
MEGMRNAYNILVGKPIKKMRWLEVPRHQWEDNIETDHSKSTASW